MFNKLAWRNVKRSFKDYLVYFLTMTIVVALMYSFSSLIFYEELEAYVEMNDFMGVMLVIATVFIVLIVACRTDRTCKGGCHKPRRNRKVTG